MKRVHESTYQVDFCADLVKEEASRRSREMLAALIEAEDEIANTMRMPMMRGIPCPALDRVRAAIDKATGAA